MRPISVIAGVRGELPQHHYSQSEITQALIDIGGDWAPFTDLLHSLHKSAKVNSRYFVRPLEDYANLTDFVVRRLSDAVPDTDAQAARHLISVIEGLRWPVLFGVYTEQQAMGILDAQLDLIF